MFMEWLTGISLSGIVSFYAFRRRSLSTSGMVAAWILGAMIFAWGSLIWFGLLLCFFVSSSVLSHIKKKDKLVVEDLFAKTGQRDIFQVLANGGVGAILALMNYIQPSDQYLIIYLGILATVNADTWGTEIGVLAQKPPRHILSWKQVEKGTSGGISFPGMMATILGAWFIGMCGIVLLHMEERTTMHHFTLIAALSGTIGALADSVLGATVQEMFQCPFCSKKTEKKLHCGIETKRIGGYTWCNNDVVNLTSSIIGGVVAWMLSKSI